MSSALSEFVHQKRIKVPVRFFEDKHMGALTDIIGQNVIIKKYQRLPIVVDGSYIFDVTYASLSLNPLVFYVIETKDLKLISEYSTSYHVLINSIPVKINANIQKDELMKKEKILVQVNAALMNDRINNSYFKYYGIIVDNPFHSYISTLDKTYGYVYDLEDLDIEIDDSPVKIFTKEEIKGESDKLISQSIYGKQFSSIQTAKSQKDIILKNVAYKISLAKITDLPFNGIIFVSKKRSSPYEVIAGLNNNFSFTFEQYKTLMNFLKTEYTNYQRFLDCNA